MKQKTMLWLQIGYWAGAVLDLLAALMMIFPALFAVMNHPVDFQPGADYRYAMGMGAPLMFAWAVLLLWAGRAPLERIEVIPITLLVVAGEVATQIWGIAAGFVSLAALLPTFFIQAVLSAVLFFSYLGARKSK